MQRRKLVAETPGLDWTAAAPTPRREVHGSSHLDAQPEPSGPTDEPQTRDEPVI